MKTVFTYPRNLLEAFICFDENWEEHISQAPYFIKVTHDGDFAILKYRQLDSDFSQPLVQMCRGTIVHIPTGRIVCLPFYKFFNYGESNAVDIDWRSAVVTEKMDGSLMKMWNFSGKWMLSTNGTIDAFKAAIGDTDETFGALFERVLGMSVQEYGDKYLQSGYVYMFELVSKENRVVIDYNEQHIYLLAARSINSLYEVPVDDRWIPNENVSFPKTYDLRSLSETVAAVQEFADNEEGVVVRDKDYNRIKIKSPAYLAAAHLANNGKITTKRLVRMIRAEQIDDFLAALPQHKEKVDEVLDAIRAIETSLREAWQRTEKSTFQSRFECVQYLRENESPAVFDYCMRRFSGKDESPEDYMSMLKESVFLKLVKGFEQKEVTV